TPLYRYTMFWDSQVAAPLVRATFWDPPIGHAECREVRCLQTRISARCLHSQTRRFGNKSRPSFAATDCVHRRGPGRLSITWVALAQMPHCRPSAEEGRDSAVGGTPASLVHEEGWRTWPRIASLPGRRR